MTTEQRLCQMLVAIVREVFEGGRDVIGERWSLLTRMRALEDAGNVAGMVEFLDECFASERGRRVGEKLKAAGRTSLETEEARFWWVLAWGCVESRVEWLADVRQGARRERLEKALSRWWARMPVQRAVSSLLGRKLGHEAPAAAVERVKRLPPLLLRIRLPDRVGALLPQAGTCYLLGANEASVCLSRATLQVVLDDRLDAIGRGRLGRVSMDLTPLLEKARTCGVITSARYQECRSVIETGNRGAHGEQVDGGAALGALKGVRRLLGEVYA